MVIPIKSRSPKIAKNHDSQSNDRRSSIPWETDSEVVQVVIAYEVVDLIKVDDEQSGHPEEVQTLRLKGITNSLLAKARIVCL